MELRLDSQGTFTGLMCYIDATVIAKRVQIQRANQILICLESSQ